MHPEHSAIKQGVSWDLARHLKRETSRCFSSFVGTSSLLKSATRTCWRRAPIFTCVVLCAQALSPNPCMTCHPKQVTDYSKTGMGRSISTKAIQPAGQFVHAPSGSGFAITYARDSMRQKVTRAGLFAEYPVNYVVGSGHRAFGFFIQIGNYFFQSPICYYTQRHGWDMAPGYEQNLTPDFNRPVTLRCLLCHSGAPRRVKGTQNRYEQPAMSLQAISCDRCHGPSSAHVASPSRSNIVNPSRQAPDARDSICEQCHLIGEASILNPGKEFDDFEPGMPLETVFTVYVGAGDENTPFRVVSHAEQLRRSSCWRRSGERMWCGSCHDPHVEPTDRAAHYRERCLRCHAATLSRFHGSPSRDCAGCHMRSRATTDGAHTVFTDHQIRIRPVEEAASQRLAALVPWRPGSVELAQRNLGLADLAIGERDQSKDFVSKALPLLVEAQKSSPRDPVVTAGLGLVLYLKSRYTEAAKAFDLAARLRPQNVDYCRDAAAAWWAAGDSARAIRDLEIAVQNDPSNEDAARMLAEIYREQNNQLLRNQALDRYLLFRPQSIEFRQRRRGEAFSVNTIPTLSNAPQ